MDLKIDYQNMFYTKCINFIIDSVGPSINFRSTYVLRSENKNNMPTKRLNAYKTIRSLPIYEFDVIIKCSARQYFMSDKIFARK